MAGIQPQQRCVLRKALLEWEIWFKNEHCTFAFSQLRVLVAREAWLKEREVHCTFASAN
jgi:hypothetical protein